MKYILATLTLLGLISAMSSTAHATNNEVDRALRSQDEISMFYRAMVTTGVLNELREDTEYTIFAPSNAAFSAIDPQTYPCFYSVQCRPDVAAILRNHIVPRRENIHALSLWGGNHIPTIGTRGLYVEETYKDSYTVDGRNVLNRGEREYVNLFVIDGVIASDQELAKFRTQPMVPLVEGGNRVIEKTVTTTYHAPSYPVVSYPAPVDSTLIPGGGGSVTYYVSPPDAPSAVTQTTTVIHSSTTEE